MGTEKDELSSDELQKATELLELLASGSDGCSISALARKAGISWYKASRLLAALEQKGLLECAVKSGRYDANCAKRLLQKLMDNARNLKFAGAMMRSVLPEENDDPRVTILKDARPVLESLARQHNEAIYMAILNGDEVLFLDMVDTLQQERAEPMVGRRFPFFSNAAGKVMRAIDSWDLLERIGKKWSGSRGRYPDLAALRVELEQIREKGVAIDCSGMGEGVITVAVAVKDYAGKVVGALMLLGPSFRLLGERLEQEIIPSLLVSAESLSMKFGYARP
jgi:IclR family transcriptional regulator, KDG regulon repressor